jgi:hypothetical protein
VRTCCIGAARRRYAATVNSACQAGDLDALWAAPARAWRSAVDMHRPQDAETVAYAGLAPSRCGAPRRTTPRAWRIGWDACRCHHPRLAYEWLSAVAGGLRTPAMPATDRSGRGHGRAMTPEFVNRPFISQSGRRRFGALASDLSGASAGWDTTFEW